MTMLLASRLAAAAIEGVPLHNAASPGVLMPECGLGTGGYGNHKQVAQGVYPECWSDGKPDASGQVPNPGVDCSKAVFNATVTWLQVGGRRIDGGDSYENMPTIGDAMVASRVPRSEMFLTTKVGDGGLGLGETDVNEQMAYYLKQSQTSYVDLLLIHWPTSSKNSTDPICQSGGEDYDAKACRIASWKALLALWKAGKARAVGVSNFNTEHLQEIVDAGLPLPAVNQIPYNPHLFSAQKELLAMCKQHGILVNSYSPLGIPDWHKYLGAEFNLLQDPKLAPLAAKHGLSPAQVLLAWQHMRGIVYNPRSMRAEHMKENLDPKVAAAKLDAADLKVLEGFPPDRCSATNQWYECCGGSQKSIPKC